jgi:hypothetical protein
VFDEQKPPFPFGKTIATLPPRLFRLPGSRVEST